MCFRRFNWQKELVNRPDFFPLDFGALTGVLSNFMTSRIAFCMNEILGVSRIGVKTTDNALGSGGIDTEIEKLGMFVFIFTKNPKSLILREFKVLLMTVSQLYRFTRQFITSGKTALCHILKADHIIITFMFKYCFQRTSIHIFT